MNWNFWIEQLIILSGLFLFFNFLIFLPGYYSFNVDPGHCEDLSDFSPEYDYKENFCNFILDAWLSQLEQTENLKPAVISLLASLLITIVYGTYEHLGIKYERLGI